MTAKQYLSSLTSSRVIVPYPATNALIETTIAQNRQGILLEAAQATADEEEDENPDSLFHHIPPDVVEFCSRCMHDTDIVTFKEI